MSASTWFLIAIGGFSLSGIALIAAVLMFIRMNIPAIIGDLNGKTVAREIQAMRNANAAAGNKHYEPSPVNAQRGRLTDPIHAPAPVYSGTRVRVGSTMKLPTEQMGTRPATAETDVLVETGGTDVLVEAGGTDVLVETGGTDVLVEAGATDVLSENVTGPLSGQTAALGVSAEPAMAAAPVSFTVTKSVVHIHTAESI